MSGKNDCSLLIAMLLTIVYAVATSPPVLTMGDQSPVDPAEANALEAKAQAWIQSHPEGYVYRVGRSKGPGFVGYPLHQLDGTTSVKKMFTYRLDHYSSIGLNFNTDINKDMSAEDLQNALLSVSFDQLPIQDLNHPANWDVYPQTPVSSFRDGVTIEKFDGSHIKISAKTKGFAIGGSRNDIDYAEDIAKPEGTYFEVRQNFPMEVVLDVPIQL